MNIDRAVVIYVSDTWKTIIEKCNKLISFYSSSIVLDFDSFDDEFNFLEISRPYTRLLDEDIKITKKTLKKCKKNKKINDYEDMAIPLIEKNELLEKEKNNFIEMHKTRRELDDFFNSFVPLGNILFFQKCLREDNEIRILTLAEMEDLEKKNLCKFMKLFSFEERQLFIKHPFRPNTYIDVNTTESEIFGDKIDCLSKIVQELGATEISGEAVFKKEEERFVKKNGTAGYRSIDFTAEEEKEQKDYYKEHYKHRDTFAGKQGSWEQAKLYALKYGLNQDRVIESLILQRAPDNPNPITSKEITFEMTSEINHSFDLAFELVVNHIKLKTDYKNIIKQRKTINYILEIKF